MPAHQTDRCAAMLSRRDDSGRLKPTVYDVAREAGVSIKTVSRVANGEPNVRDETRLRVQKVIEALGYRPNPHARYLSSLR